MLLLILCCVLGVSADSKFVSGIGETDRRTDRLKVVFSSQVNMKTSVSKAVQTLMVKTCMVWMVKSFGTQTSVKEKESSLCLTS